MRAIFIIACVGLTFAAGAQAQDAVKACRQLKDDAERLKCYDRLDTSASNAPRGQRESKAEAETGWVVNDEKSPLDARPGEIRPGGEPAWIVSDEKSPLDDSPLVSAALPSGDGKSHLLMRCKDRKTEVAVSIRGFIKCGSDVRVTYRIDQAQATEAPWNAHSSCYLALAPSPIPFIQSLTDDGKVYVRMFDHHGAAYDALFNLGKVSKIRSRLAEACDWDGASKATEKPAPQLRPASPRRSRNDASAIRC